VINPAADSAADPAAAPAVDSVDAHPVTLGHLPTTDELEAHRVPGFTWACWRDGGDIATGAVGATPTGRALRADTPLQVGSTSKLIAAVTALSLVADATLTLDGELGDSIEGWRRPDGTTVTVRSILSHSSGLGVHGYLGYPTAASMPTRAQFVGGTGDLAAVGAGTVAAGSYEYSGGGYELLALAIEQLTQTSFTQLVHERVFRRAAMVSSFFVESLHTTRADDGAPLIDAVSTAAFDGQPLQHDGFQYHPEHAAAGVWSTAPDVARLLRELWLARRAQSTILPVELARLMVTDTGLCDADDASAVGLGCFLVGNGSWYRHGGRTIGYCSTNLAGVDEPAAAVALTNGFPGGTPVGQAACRALLGDLADRP
jgi:CubicO group peptidase (beta-lactamase class C family)